MDPFVIVGVEKHEVVPEKVFEIHPDPYKSDKLLTLKGTHLTTSS